MRHFLLVSGFFICLSIVNCPLYIPPAAALTYRHQHHIFDINPAAYPQWKAPAETWTLNGRVIDPAPAWRAEGDDVPPLPQGVIRSLTPQWNRAAIGATLDKLIGKELRRPRGSVTIRKGADGKATFEGVGLTGREVNLETAVDLTLRALAGPAVSEIALPIRETQPHIRVEDPELAAQGIQEVVTIGESNFAGSPVNRKYNIGVGLARFNGHFVPKDALFSFNEVLGKVDGSTGYKLELVIKGDRTEPDYGGGLCQISTTAYRGIWEYGFPILRRKNHSYTVRYYSPPGTDATVYPGAVDMVFRNDSPGALLLQTHHENDKAYFIYYGTKDTRTADMIGPFITGRVNPPPDRTELTTDLPPGEKKKLNERVPGLTAVWYRLVTKNDEEMAPEKVVSIYEARPLFYAVGVAELPPGYDPKVTGELGDGINTAEPPRAF